MLESHKIYLYDRIKETSYTIGNGDFVLNGASNGFSSFGSAYNDGDSIFYAATDGTFYEVGSGVYVTGVQNSLIRFPFRSTNNNAKVNFGEGLKEIFVTYPATNSVFSASGLQSSPAPQESGLAFWSSSHILNYDSNIVWDSTNSRLGIKKSNPSFSIDIGGNGPQSIIRSSGLYVGSSGILFPSGNNGDSSYIGGRQLAHYEPNAVNLLTGSDQVIELSGVAKNNILFKKQNAGLVFAGPASGCTPPCSPDYPSFRPLLLEDIYDFDVTVSNDGSGLSINQNLGIFTSQIDGKVTSYNDFSELDWINSAYLASGTSGGAVSLVESVSGYSIYTTMSGVNLNFGHANIDDPISPSLVIDNFNGVSAGILDFYGEKIKIRNSYTPTSSSGVGETGEICWDNDYVYVCVATDTWKRLKFSLVSW